MKIDIVVAGYIFDNKRVLLVHHKKLDLWLPVGGHIDENETPDDALLREIKEETSLDVDILNQSDVPIKGNINRNLACPFYVNVHHVKDHQHCCFFYVCKALNPDMLKINHELNDYGWFLKNELDTEHIPLDVKNIALKAFQLIEKETN